MRRPLLAVISSAILVGMPTQVRAQVLTFDDIVGATTGTVTIGTSYSAFGIEFVGSAIAFCLNRTEARACSNTSWGSGELGNAARDRNTHAAGMTWKAGTPTMNRSAGFTTGFSFYYANPEQLQAAFEVWSELDGTGTLLAGYALQPTEDGGSAPGCFASNYCSFQVGSVQFAGLARSVVFRGDADLIAFDDITFGAVLPGEPVTVPEPRPWALLVVGMAVLAGVRSRRALTGRR